MSASPSTAELVLPNLVVIGVAKCGTTSLHYYLDLHPEIQMSQPKELNFFIDELATEGQVAVRSDRELRFFANVERNWSRGLDWYAAKFDASAPVRGEASVGYTAAWFPGVAERMAGSIPDARLIFMVRDPIERARSHYMQECADGLEWRSFSDAVRDPLSVYLVRSRYHAQLKPFLEHFPRSSILIAEAEELLRERRRAMRLIFEHAGVRPDFWSDRMRRERHRSAVKGRLLRGLQRARRPVAGLASHLPGDVRWRLEHVADRRRSRELPKPGIDEELRRWMAGQLAEDAARFRELSGLPFAAWSV
jgi:hypothetical protein